MKMLVGLGNVGAKYAETRHNIGWVALDSFAHKHDVELSVKPKLEAMVAKATIDGEDVLFVKPTTMMNSSGQAVQKVAHFYKIKPEGIMVVYDELDILFGNVKTKQGGSGGSHNGLNSVIDHIGSDFWRMRIGIDRQPRGIPEPADFVLAKFAPDEEQQLDELIASSNNMLASQLSNFETTSYQQ
jgi:PTH1 family peptidyl-tRNA hydrolase